MRDARIVGVGVEIGDAEVDARFVSRVLPTDVLADGKAFFIGIVTKRNERPCGGSAKRDERRQVVVQLQFHALIRIVFEDADCPVIGVN